MPVINFDGADKVVLGSEADRVYLGNEMMWEAMKKTLFYDCASGKPFDFDGLEVNEKVIVIPKKDFPLDLMQKEEDEFGDYPDTLFYSFNIVTMDMVIGSLTAPRVIKISFGKHKDQPFNPTEDTVWNLFNQKKIDSGSRVEYTNIKFVADWIDKIYIVEE